MTMTPENWRKRMDELQKKSDAFLKARVPNYDPEKAKAFRERLREKTQAKK